MKMVLHGLLKVAGVQKEPRDSWRRGQTSVSLSPVWVITIEILSVVPVETIIVLGITKDFNETIVNVSRNNCPARHS